MQEKEITEKLLSRFSVVYFYVALFGMRERDIAKEKEFDIVLYMTLE